MSLFRSVAFLCLAVLPACGVPDSQLDLREGPSTSTEVTTSNELTDSSAAPAPAAARSLGMLKGKANQELMNRLGGAAHEVSISATLYDFGAQGQFVAARLLVVDSRGVVAVDGYASGNVTAIAPSTTVVVRGQQVNTAIANEYFGLAMVSLVPALEQADADGACANAGGGWGCWWKFLVMAATCAGSVGALAAALAACIGTAGTGCALAALASVGAGAACINEARNWFCCVTPEHPWCLEGQPIASDETR